LAAASNQGCPILVDPPRDEGWANYGFGTTIFKPNMLQSVLWLKSCFSTKGLKAKYYDIDPSTSSMLTKPVFVFCAVRKELDANEVPYKYLWLTLGRDGSVIGSSREDSIYRSDGVVAHTIDVVGAGDTAMAAMADHLFKAQNLGWETVKEGIDKANVAGAMAVEHAGTYAIVKKAYDKRYGRIKVRKSRSRAKRHAVKPQP
jgi:bifunctional ADP-heptose synthase (sugar kinase/adenylyltransferase)